MYCSHKTGHSLTVGPGGPVLLEDTILHETLETFVNKKILERVVHTKGYGAFGVFTCTHSMRPFTRAAFLQIPGQRTNTFSRFSLAVSTKGTPDTSRNVRGFSTKFYTSAGVFDLLTNHIPVFLVRDAMKFPASIQSLSPSPSNNLPAPSAFWMFVAQNPEAVHFLTWLYSDIGTVASFRYIRTYGVNTYVWENEEGIRRYVKYHWLPLAGERDLTRQEAIRLAGENPDIAGEDLYDTIASGTPVEFELCVQIMDIDAAPSLPFDPLDDTKVWDEEQFPLHQAGRLTLNRNTDNYMEQVEKSAFSPANLLDGISLSNDKMLQGRSTIYWDAQRRRIGPDFRSIPINHMENWNPSDEVTSGEREQLCGIVMRARIPDPDNFTQAGIRYRAFTPQQREHLEDNIASVLHSMTEPVRGRILSYLSAADSNYGRGVMEKMEGYPSI